MILHAARSAFKVTVARAQRFRAASPLREIGCGCRFLTWYRILMVVIKQAIMMATPTNSKYELHDRPLPNNTRWSAVARETSVVFFAAVSGRGEAGTDLTYTGCPSATRHALHIQSCTCEGRRRAVSVFSTSSAHLHAAAVSLIESRSVRARTGDGRFRMQGSGLRWRRSLASGGGIQATAAGTAQRGRNGATPCTCTGRSAACQGSAGSERLEWVRRNAVRVVLARGRTRR